jgi:hypothetical protein
MVCDAQIGDRQTYSQISRLTTPIRALLNRLAVRPEKGSPRSILISSLVVAAIYLALNLSILGRVPGREFVPADASPIAGFVVSAFMEDSTERSSRASSRR